LFKIDWLEICTPLFGFKNKLYLQQNFTLKLRRTLYIVYLNSVARGKENP